MGDRWLLGEWLLGFVAWRHWADEQWKHGDDGS
jgi:hypothetical protein